MRIDRAADRIAHHPTRPPIEDQVHKARLDRDVGYVRDPELIGTIDLLVASEIGDNRTLVIAVGRDDVPSAALGLQAVSRMSRRIFLPLTITPWWRNSARARR